MQSNSRKLYIPVRYKLVLASLGALAWFAFSIYLALPWVADLSALITPLGAWLAVAGVALIPGLANAFLVAGLLLDKRPVYPMEHPLPPVSVLVAAFNEEMVIRDTLLTLIQQYYPGTLEIIVIDDGSSDRSANVVEELIAEMQLGPATSLQLVRMPQNGGKAAALNAGLRAAAHEIIVTADADTYVRAGSLAALVHHLVDGPPNTAAVAGTVLVRNSRSNFISRLQEWDYFHGIAVVKRIQSLFQGTLVAQGAFSAYRREVLNELNGWHDSLGEDIVLTWGMLARGYRVGYAENAFVFTNVPENYKQFYRQRKRWSRGMIESFKAHPEILLKPRFNTPFIYLNLLFPYMDLAFVLVFIPGLIAALFFQFYAVVGAMTLILLPLSLFINGVMYIHQRRIFRTYGLKVRKNFSGFLFYILVYQIIMAPATIMGYLAELLHLRKLWGTK